MSFLNIQSSWDSGPDDEDYFIRTGPDFLDSHPTPWDDDDQSDDDDEFTKIMKKRREKSEKRDNASAERIGGEMEFGQKPPQKKKVNGEDVNELPINFITTGDVFYHPITNMHGLFVGKDFRKQSENSVLLFAEGFDSFRDDDDDDENISAYPFRKYGLSNMTYVTSFDEPLTANTIQYFLFHYSNKQGWSADKKNKFYRKIDSFRERFGEFLELWGVRESPSEKKTIPGRIDLSIWKNY